MKKYSFTLIELLVVIAMIGIIMGVALPAFTRIAKGKEINQAAADIRAQLAVARSYAITNRVMTAVIFPQQISGKLEGLSAKSGVNQPSAYFNASCRAAVVYKDSSGDYVFKNWLPDSEWSFFTPGIIIPPTNDNFYQCTNTGTNKDDVKGVKSVQFAEILAPSETAETTMASYVKSTPVERAIIFNTSGQAVSENFNFIKIRLAEAMFDMNSSFIPTNKPEGDSKIPYTMVTVNPLTGKTAITYETDGKW